MNLLIIRCSSQFSCEVHAIGARGFGLGSRAGQIGTVLPPLRRFFGAVLPKRYIAAEMGPATRYMLRRNTASV